MVEIENINSGEIRIHGNRIEAHKSDLQNDVGAGATLREYLNVSSKWNGPDADWGDSYLWEMIHDPSEMITFFQMAGYEVGVY